MCFNAGQNLGKSHAAPLGALYSIYTKSPGSRLGLHHVATIVAKNSKVSAIRLEAGDWRLPGSTASLASLALTLGLFGLLFAKFFSSATLEEFGIVPRT